MVRKQALWVLVLLLWVTGALASEASDKVVVIELQHGRSATIAAAIRPLVGAAGFVRRVDNKLIIQSTSARLRRIRQLVRTLDVQPRQLLIRVRQNANEQQRDAAAGVSGRIGKHDALQARLSMSTAHFAHTADQHVRVLEGYSAIIRVGSEIPVVEQRLLISTGRPALVQRQYYQQVTTGFRVVPQLHGNHFTLDIAPQMQDQRTVQGNIRVNEMHTTVSGMLGQWVDIGGALQTLSGASARLIHGAKNRAVRAYHVWVKVTAMP